MFCTCSPTHLLRAPSFPTVPHWCCTQHTEGEKLIFPIPRLCNITTLHTSSYHRLVTSSVWFADSEERCLFVFFFLMDFCWFPSSSKVIFEFVGLTLSKPFFTLLLPNVLLLVFGDFWKLFRFCFTLL